MKDDEFQKHFEEALALKKNSFSRTLLLSYKDDLAENADWYVNGNPDLSRELAWYLYNYDLLNIHAIDEKEAPVPFSTLEKIYGDYVFVLQMLEKKNSLMLLIQDVSEESKGFPGREQSIVNVFRSTWKWPYRTKTEQDSYLDFGFLKNAMTLRKTYGIQDLLEVGFSLFMSYKEKRAPGIYIVPKMTSCRMLFNFERPELSTLTLSAPNLLLTLQGKTKIIEKPEFVEKIRFALKIFKACRTF